MELNGYKCRTTFWDDFSIADKFGVSAIVDTYERAFKEWKHNYIYLTELVMVLNHKLWDHYTEGNHSFAETYNVLWDKTAEYALEHLKGDELTYYWQITD
jgi:hypothetical protein